MGAVLLAAPVEAAGFEECTGLTVKPYSLSTEATRFSRAGTKVLRRAGASDVFRRALRDREVNGSRYDERYRTRELGLFGEAGELEVSV